LNESLLDFNLIVILETASPLKKLKKKKKIEEEEKSSF
jgi:hypothetical protein